MVVDRVVVRKMVDSRIPMAPWAWRTQLDAIPG